MTVTEPVRRIAIDEYLAGEERSEVRHEYVDGAVYAMVGSTVGHNLIASRVHALLMAHLEGSPCRTFRSAMDAPHSVTSAAGPPRAARRGASR
jgi:Uma2 family endonuclease